MVEKSGQDARQGRIVKGGKMVKILVISLVLLVIGYVIVSQFV